MKVKALTRASSAYQAPGSDVTRQPRNLDPSLHSFARARGTCKFFELQNFTNY